LHCVAAKKTDEKLLGGMVRQFFRIDDDINSPKRTESMTPDESRKLKPGTRVSFNGDPADLGTVSAVEPRYVTVKWDDGHRSFTGHKNMQRIELARK
jgi:hypothetical protein